MKDLRFIVATVLALSIFSMQADQAVAQQDIADGVIGIELNTLTDAGKACRFSFVMKNDAAHDVEKLSAEFALFDKGGLLAKLTVFNFGKLQHDRTMVKQFEIAGAGCDTYSRMLLNAVKSCEGFSDDLASCEAAIRPTNKAGIEFGN